MSHKTVLRLLVSAQLILLPVIVALAFVLEGYLPQQLQDYLRWEQEQALERSELILAIVGLGFLIVWFISLVGLLLVKKWGFWGFLLSFVGLNVLCSFLGPSIYHSSEYVFDTVISALDGAIIALCLWGRPFDEHQCAKGD